MLLVALCGLKRSGKDVAARYLCDYHGFAHRKISQQLKEITRIAFDLSNDELENELKDVVSPKWGVSPRVLMDFLGTHVFQYELHSKLPDTFTVPNRCFWIDNVLLNDETIANQTRVVLSDLLFKHELERIKQSLPNTNLVTIRIYRDGTSTDTLASEMEQGDLPVDYVVYNNGTLSDLYARLNAIMKDAQGGIVID